jgi:hypothetical protein
MTPVTAHSGGHYPIPPHFTNQTINHSPITPSLPARTETARSGGHHSITPRPYRNGTFGRASLHHSPPLPKRHVRAGITPLLHYLTNQQVNKSTNQLINQSTNQPINHNPITPPLHHSTTPNFTKLSPRPLQHCTTATQQHRITATLHHSNTASLQHCNTPLSNQSTRHPTHKGQCLRRATQSTFSQSLPENQLLNPNLITTHNTNNIHSRLCA